MPCRSSAGYLALGRRSVRLAVTGWLLDASDWCRGGSGEGLVLSKPTSVEVNALGHLARLALVFLAVNLVFLAAILVGNPDALLSPDSEGYLQMADWYRAGEPASLFPGPFLLLARPPVYPWLLRVVGASSQHIATGIALSYGFALAAVVGTFLLCRRWTGGKVAFVVALLLLLDPLFIKYTHKILTEVPFLALFVWSFLALKPADRASRPSALLCGMLQGAAILVRPILVFWPVVQTLAVLAVQRAQIGPSRSSPQPRPQLGRALVALALYLCSAYSPALVWSLHNYREHGYFGVSCIGTHNLVFYKAVRVLEVAGMRDPEGYLVGLLEQRQPGVMDEPFAKRTAAYKSVGIAIAIDHPIASVVAGVDSLRRILIQPSAPEFVQRGSAFRVLYNLLKNLHLLTSLLLVLWVGLSLFRLARAADRRWNPLLWEHGEGILVMLLAVAYFCLLSIPEGNARFRLPFLPFLYVLAGIGIHLGRAGGNRSPLPAGDRLPTEEPAGEGHPATSGEMAVAARSTEELLAFTPVTRIALITPKRLGDAIFHTPLVAHLRRCLPEARLDILAITPLSGEVFRHNPHVNDVIVAPDQARLAGLAGQFEWAISCYATDTAQEYARALRAPREILVSLAGEGHVSVQILRTVCTAMGLPVPAGVVPYELYPTSADEQTVPRWLAAEGVDPDRHVLVGLHPGCRSLSKRRWKFWKRMEHEKTWSPERLAAFARALIDQDTRIRIVMTGTQGEQRLCQAVRRAVGPAAVSLLDRTNVQQLAALMGRLACYVTPDTGTMHVAAASAVPLVGLFGPTDANVTGPFPGRRSFTALIRKDVGDITVADALAAVVAYLPPPEG